MRLWHQSLIPYLPRQQLLGQHRELCALRGKGWGRKHSVVDYVFKYNPSYLIAYHYLIMDEMVRRGYCPDPIWRNPSYRGKELGSNWLEKEWQVMDYEWIKNEKNPIYPEHNNEYLRKCLDNLKNKGIILDETKIH